ncbi:MAG: sigma-70 family RNA polymerase sigma factor [Scytonematopsis contorta HA4267-MV1]|jgi:RNA polymerase sigma factor (sigma-70 family)|nr:sigma-70 family RNA polymerase sigma factor [Scytonematopsis contorta HA4267-MV1]
MHPRNGIIETFSTFLEFDADNFRRWATDGRLRRSMETNLKTLPQESSENYWALYWYNVTQQESPRAILAKQHLTAYFQEPCYWTSQKAAASFKSNQYSLSDCFQIAISKIDKILKGFDPNQGSILKNYAGVIFASAIRETLRQRHEVDICTEWGLLRKISQKRLIEALEAAGLPKDTINSYVIAWNCFKTLYVPNQVSATRQLTKPDNQTWSAITQTYNNQTNSSLTPQILENWLLACAKHGRNYLYPKTTSINISASGDDSSEWVDNIAGAETDSPLSQIMSQEEEANKACLLVQMREVLLAALTELEPQAKEILQFYYVQGLTQQQIAQQMQIQQYTVSRRLTKARETLLRNLAKWSQQNLHMQISSDILKGMSAVMEEWLQAYYKSSGNSVEC